MNTMNYDQIEASLNNISEELDKIEEKRESLLRESRDAISLFAKAITDIHSMNLEAAELKINQGNDLLKKLREISISEDYDLNKYLIVPETEYVEASTLYSIALNKPFPTYEELKVNNVSYLYGLLDTIGEIKRRIYDEIRRGNSKEASTLFEIMEHLYLFLLPFAAYDRLAQGLRRKLDVARILIENTRSAITEESRRSELIKSMEKLSERLLKYE